MSPGRKSQPCADLSQTDLSVPPWDRSRKPKNCFILLCFLFLAMFAALARCVWVNGQEEASQMSSLNFRSGKCKQHHFFKWRLGPVGRRWGKHVHTCTLSRAQPPRVTHQPLSLSEQPWRFVFSPSELLQAAGLCRTIQEPRDFTGHTK